MLLKHSWSPEAELAATFAGREALLEGLLNRLRDGQQAGAASGFLVTGSEGAGKSTCLRMMALRLGEDVDLSEWWLPILFAEEPIGVVSLRDFLAATLRLLAGEHQARTANPPEAPLLLTEEPERPVRPPLPSSRRRSVRASAEINAGQERERGKRVAAPVNPAALHALAAEWWQKARAEADDDLSQGLAIAGLREVSRLTGRRLLLLVDGLDRLVESFTNEMRSALRGLLLAEPLVLVGSARERLEALRLQDQRFYDCFTAVPLGRLSEEEALAVATRRAAFEENEPVRRQLLEQQASFRAAVQLAGGNPRRLLLYYELLSRRPHTTLEEYNHHLMDELTPGFRRDLQDLPRQQRQLLHALMEARGTAQPRDLVAPSRLPLNGVTTQLQRLKATGLIKVLGGGKGCAANYTVSDSLFGLWYQTRCLSQHGPRISLFLALLRFWFDEECRVTNPPPGSGVSQSPVVAVDSPSRAEAAPTSGPEQGTDAFPLMGEGSWESVKPRFEQLVRTWISRPQAEALEQAVRFLSRAASSGAREAWAFAGRILVPKLPPELRATLEFVSPAGAILQGGDRGALHRLPPEQREFAETVLARFDRKAPG